MGHCMLCASLKSPNTEQYTRAFNIPFTVLMQYFVYVCRAFVKCHTNSHLELFFVRHCILLAHGFVLYNIPDWFLSKLLSASKDTTWLGLTKLVISAAKLARSESAASLSRSMEFGR